jgi:hypothetical protein
LRFEIEYTDFLLTERMFRVILYGHIRGMRCGRFELLRTFSVERNCMRSFIVAILATISIVGCAHTVDTPGHFGDGVPFFSTSQCKTNGQILARIDCPENPINQCGLACIEGENGKFRLDLASNR